MSDLYSTFASSYLPFRLNATTAALNIVAHKIANSIFTVQEQKDLDTVITEWLRFKRGLPKC